MNNKDNLKQFENKIHTTNLGVERIKKNLQLQNIDVVEYCKSKIISDDCFVEKKGKNYYCENKDITVVVNATSYTIITAKLKNE